MVVSPVIVAERVEGYCLLLRSDSGNSKEISTIERLAVLQGAGAAALAWSREQAVGAVEEKMRAVFLDELLATEIADEEAWIQRGHSLGFDLTKPHTAWLIQAEGIQDWPNALRQYLAAKQDPVLLSVRAEVALLFWPCDNPKSGRDFKSSCQWPGRALHVDISEGFTCNRDRSPGSLRAGVAAQPGAGA